MFNKLKKLKDAFTKGSGFTQSNTQNTDSPTQNSLSAGKPSVKPKSDSTKYSLQEKFGGLTQEQMRRIDDSGVSSLRRAIVGEDAQKSLNTQDAASRNKKPVTDNSSILSTEENSENELDLDSNSTPNYNSNKNHGINPNDDLFHSAIIEANNLNQSSDTHEDNTDNTANTDITDNSLKDLIINSTENNMDKTLSNKNSLFVKSSVDDKFPLTPEGVMFAQTIATNYSQGDTQGCILQLRNYLNQNKGEVNHKFWYMLMDIYQIIDNRIDFEKTAMAFAQLFNTSPPSWSDNLKDDKRNMMAGKNILILEETLSMEYITKFKDFFKAAKQEKFCRINVSHCRFEHSEIEALNEFYKLLLQLRKNRIKSFLMGESSLINFCKSYINYDKSNKGLKKIFIENEPLLWNIYLEILQWKGNEEEFEELAIKYANKFELSPNGWEAEGVMSLELLEDEDDKPKLDTSLNNTNIHILSDILKYDFAKLNKAELDFSHVERVDFSTCGTISFTVQEILSKPENKMKEIFLIRPNELIITLFDMLGTTDSFKVVQKKR